MTRTIQFATLLLSAGALLVFPDSAAFGQTVGSSVRSPPQSFLTGNTAAAANSPIGFSVADVNGQLIVTGAAANGSFGGLGLQVGDLITGVNGQPVATFSDLLNRLLAIGNTGTTGQLPTASIDISRN